MGGGLAANEDSGEVFLRRNFPSVRGRSYPAIQELDTPSFLPATFTRRNSKLPGRGNNFVNWIRSRLFWHGFRLARQEVRPLGRRIDSFTAFQVNSHERAKND